MRCFYFIIVAIVMAISPITLSCNQPGPITETVTLTDIRQINEDGFGEGGFGNDYAWSMTVFNNELYVGTLNFILEGEETPLELSLGNEEADPLIDPVGCQIWRYDGNSWTNCTYHFTTRSSYQPEAPTGFSADASGRFAIGLSWTADDEADSTYIEWSANTGPWNRGEGSFVG